MKRLQRKILLVLLVVPLLGCASRESEAESFRQSRAMIADDVTIAHETVEHLDWLISNSYIKQGMSDQELIALLGKPDLDQDNAAGHLFLYELGPSQSLQVIVKDAKVMEFGVQYEEGHKPK